MWGFVSGKRIFYVCTFIGETYLYGGRNVISCFFKLQGSSNVKGAFHYYHISPQKKTFQGYLFVNFFFSLKKNIPVHSFSIHDKRKLKKIHSIIKLFSLFFFKKKK